MIARYAIVDKTYHEILPLSSLKAENLRKNGLFSVYAKLPVFMQNIACSAAGLKMRRERYTRQFHNALAFLRESQWWPKEEQQAYQDEQLRKVIAHAYEKVPYYREVFDTRRLKPEDIQCTADLYKLPILSKSTVRQRFADLQAAGYPKSRIRHGHTSGSTGTSMHFTMDRDTHPYQWAVWWRHRERFGLKLHDPFIVFAGRSVVPLDTMKPPFWRYNLPMGQTYISVHHLTKQNLPVAADYLCRRRVKYYAGYPSALYLVACYFVENNIKLPHPPQVVVSGSETLLPHQREIISEAFAADMADQYGASEHCGNISECEMHAYHVDFELGVVEFLPMEGMPPNVRRIVCTGFHNKAMPFIRYDIGDIATIGKTECTCGRHSPTVEKIDGRIESYILTPDGRQLGRLGFLTKFAKRIEEAQLVQDSLSEVTVRIVRTGDYTQADETQFISNMRRYVGDQIAIKMEYVNAIPREANGKFRHIVSSVFQDKHLMP